MKHLAPLVLCCLLVAGCAAQSASVPAAVPPGDAAPPQTPSAVAAPAVGSRPAAPEPQPSAYVPEQTLTLEQTVAAYFEQQYRSYLSLQYIDITSLLDMDASINQNLVVWQQALIQRRRLLEEHSLCYVERDAFSWRIEYDDGPEESRVEFMRGRGRPTPDDEVTVYFRIRGEPGRAYPPIMAPNAQHSMRLRQQDGVWQITHHFFPGSVRKFMRSTMKEVPPEQEMLDRLREEFADAPAPGELSAPQGAAVRDAALSVDYALRYTEQRNPMFYDVGDMLGNCNNFTSQCIWYGFGGGEMPDMAAFRYMTKSWFAGSGGGMPAWENVEQFWDFLHESREMGAVTFGAIAQAQPGDILQTQSFGAEETDRYNHSLILVDGERLVFGQNSPGCFVYYSDLFNVNTRFIRPIYVLE